MTKISILQPTKIPSAPKDNLILAAQQNLSQNDLQSYIKTTSLLYTSTPEQNQRFKSIIFYQIMLPYVLLHITI